MKSNKLLEVEGLLYLITNAEGFCSENEINSSSKCFFLYSSVTLNPIEAQTSSPILSKTAEYTRLSTVSITANITANVTFSTTFAILNKTSTNGNSENISSSTSTSTTSNNFSAAYQTTSSATFTGTTSDARLSVNTSTSPISSPSTSIASGGRHTAKTFTSTPTTSTTTTVTGTTIPDTITAGPIIHSTTNFTSTTPNMNGNNVPTISTGFSHTSTNSNSTNNQADMEDGITNKETSRIPITQPEPHSSSVISARHDKTTYKTTHKTTYYSYISDGLAHSSTISDLVPWRRILLTLSSTTNTQSTTQAVTLSPSADLKLTTSNRTTKKHQKTTKCKWRHEDHWHYNCFENYEKK